MINNFLKISRLVFIKSFLGIVIVMMLFQPFTLLACGLSMVRFSDTWTFGKDSAEQSFIDYTNGEEKLIISRHFADGTDNTVWIIPVPASPAKVEIDILSDLPRFIGYDIYDQASENLKKIRNVLLATQFFPAVPIFLKGIFFSANDIPTGVITRDLVIPNGVKIYEHIEKEGMVAEVLSTSNSDALYEYLNDKGLKVEKNSITILQDYIGNDFSFVASWISPSAVGDNTKGLMMTFPTNKIFYPLKPESGTPGDGLPETITVVGHVTPDLFQNIKDSTTVGYYYSEQGLTGNDFFSSTEGFGFTRIIINVKPSKLTQDLYISPTTPIKVRIAQLINLNTFNFGVVLLILISLLATLLAVQVVIPVTVNRSKLLGLIVGNCLTIIGTIIGSRIYLQEKRLKFVFVFSLIFTILTFILVSLLSIWF